jgi:hypothetical protein
MAGVQITQERLSAAIASDSAAFFGEGQPEVVAQSYR